MTRLKLKTTWTIILIVLNLEWTCSLIFDSFEPVNNLYLQYWLECSWKQLVLSFLTRLKLKTTCTFILVVWIWNQLLVSFDLFELVNNLYLHYWLECSWKQLVPSFLTRFKLKTPCNFILVVWIWNQLLVSILTRLSL